MTCKYQKERIKTTKKMWKHHFPNNTSKSMAEFLDFQGQIHVTLNWLKWKLLDMMHALDTYKFEMDQIKSNWEKLAKTFF